MPKATISNTAWTEVVTTTSDTVFQNQSGVNPIYITTEGTESLPFDSGFYLPPNTGVVIGAGIAVSAVTFNSPATLFYMEV
jgi:hypothetical protein